MLAIFRRTALASTALALTLFASTANAQAIFGAAEVDDDDVSLFLLGGSWSPGGLGWKPLVSVVGYNLRFPSGLGGTLSRNVVTPSLGLINVLPDQSYSFSAGYAFSDDDLDFPLPVAAPSGDGFVGQFGWDYWGTTGRRSAQVLAAYNFGQEFLWTRGRAAVPLSSTSPLWAGGELAFYGGGDPSFYIAQFGPTLEYRFTPQFRLGGSAGLKVGMSNYPGSAVYGRLEFLWLPNAK